MASTPNKRSNLLNFLLIFLLVYFGTQLFFGNSKDTKTLPSPGLAIHAVSSRFTIGHHPELTVTNIPVSSEQTGTVGWIESKLCGFTKIFTGKTAQECRALAVIERGETLTLPSRCPEPPVDLFTIENAGQATEKLTEVTSVDTVAACEPALELQPGDTVKLSLAPWKYSLFEREGVYEARLPGAESITPPPSSTGSMVTSPTSVRFEITEPGAFTKLFRTFVTAPLLNFLILIASFMPGHSLGLAIILLTIAIKLLLFLPTQHAMEGQKKMQMLQPKLQELQKKYEGDQKKIQEETMKLWKEHKINPFSSCLPMLLQFPILIGLFYTVRDGSVLSLSRHLVYSFYENLDWHFPTTFLGLDLLKPEIFVFPILLVVLQFLQMKLTFAIQKRKKKSKDDVIDVGGNKAKPEASAQDMQQKLMLYVLPFMIGFFALQFPAAVSIYWGVSTLFGIGQQMIVNKEHLRL